MSDINKNQDANKDVDPIDEVLAVETPVVNDSVGGKKKKPAIAKIGLFVFAGAMSILIASQFMGGSSAPTVAGQEAGAAIRNSDVNSFRQAPASAQSMNPEAVALAEKKEQERAAEKQKEPGASYFKQDPFGEGATIPVVVSDQPTVPPPPPPLNMNPQPQSVPSTPAVANNNGQEDPAVTFARMLHAQATKSPRLGLTPAKPSEAAAQAVSNNGNGAATAPGTAVMDATVAAGEISYALLTSGLNSRVPQTPPRAIIHGGPLNGAVLLGVMENANDEYLVLRFKSLTIGKKTYPIEAIAVNPELRDAGIADEVHSHLFQKTAIQAGVGFLQTFGAAKLQEGTTISNSYGNGGGSSVTQTPKRTNKETAMIAAGGAAQAISPAIDQAINSIRPEVIIHPNKEMGILFLKPLFLQ